MSTAWSDSLATNVPILDTQHKELFSRIARLEASMEQGKAKKELGKLLSFLTEYTDEHFGYEEGYMDAWDYPDYREHKWQHDHFRENIVRITESLSASGPSSALAAEVRRVLAQWLVEHIEVQDKRMGIWLGGVLAREARQSD